MNALLTQNNEKFSPRINLNASIATDGYAFSQEEGGAVTQTDGKLSIILVFFFKEYLLNSVLFFDIIL